MRSSCAGLARISSPQRIAAMGQRALAPRFGGRGGPSQAKPSQAKRVDASVRRRSRSRVGTAHLLRTIWAQNTLLIETANACDVTRCGVAMEALPEKTEFAAPVIVLNRFERT